MCTYAFLEYNQCNRECTNKAWGILKIAFYILYSPSTSCEFQIISQEVFLYHRFHANLLRIHFVQGIYY